LTTPEEAADSLKVKNPLPRYAGVLNLWEYMSANELRFKVIHPEDIMAGIERGKAGDIMIILEGHGLGHTGLVVNQINNMKEHTREGNTNNNGSREGDGVYNKTRKVDSHVLKAFVRVK
jgi:hypothetical protein